MSRPCSGRSRIRTRRRHPCCSWGTSSCACLMRIAYPHRAHTSDPISVANQAGVLHAWRVSNPTCQPPGRKGSPLSSAEQISIFPFLRAKLQNLRLAQSKSRTPFAPPPKMNPPHPPGTMLAHTVASAFQHCSTLFAGEGGATVFNQREYRVNSSNGFQRERHALRSSASFSRAGSNPVATHFSVDDKRSHRDSNVREEMSLSCAPPCARTANHLRHEQSENRATLGNAAHIHCRVNRSNAGQRERYSLRNSMTFSRRSSNPVAIIFTGVRNHCTGIRTCARKKDHSAAHQHTLAPKTICAMSTQKLLLQFATTPRGKSG